MEANVDPSIPGSRLDADHPEKGVLFARRFTSGTAHVPQQIAAASLIGVDLGPNLSITGSLATILWLAALRREGQSVQVWRFLRLGIVIMFPALASDHGSDGHVNATVST